MGEIGKNKDVNEAKQHEVTNNVEIKEKSKEDIDEARKKLEDSLNSDSDIVEQKNPHIEEIDGKKYYYDDNGKLYRVQDNLAPNTEYEINGYKYKTDDNGRVISAEGTLHIKNHDGKLQIKDSMDKIGKGDEKEGDQRGHLIGDQFDGSNGLENLIPQDADVNMKDYKNFENDLAKEVKSGKEVTVKIEPVYEGDSRRPDAIVVTYSIDGEESVRVFPNNKER
ncbi:MAG: DNA/RNA non-specific endonuclease [Peptoanaerobacter stomatis]|uniref:DNA/RNA non-specific endonuclease n=1 Tax=Peptoanaerobacter stomatis TaxID=796937 RepID=UPI003FA0B80F